MDASTLEHAADLREAVGLDSGPAIVAESYWAESYNCSEFGIPLTPTEIEQFYSVLIAQTELSDYVETVVNDPDYAGSYLDGDVLTLVSLSGELGADFEPSAGSVELVSAQYSDAELQAVASHIANLTRHPDSGNQVPIRYVNADPRLNRVEVRVAGEVGVAEAALREEYGDIVVVNSAVEEEGGLLACNGVLDCGTRGGLAINHFSPRAPCTSGFLVRAKPANSSTWTRYVLTAGHCVDGGGGVGNTNKWRNGGDQVSDPFTIQWGKNQFQDFWPWTCGAGGAASCLAGDLGLIGMNGVVPPSWNTYFTGASWRSITGSKTKSQQQVGQIVCRHGRTSGRDCGQITGKAEQATYNFGFANLFGSVQVGLASAGGDSGSGFYRVPWSGDYADAYGILSAGTGNTTFYFALQPFYKSPDFCDPVDVQVCASTSCPL